MGKEEKMVIVYGREREDHIFQMKSETVTKAESENAKSEDVIEKAEELKKEDIVADVKNEDVQQSGDAELSVRDDNKKLEIGKNYVNEKEEVAEIGVIDDCSVPDVV